ncbi:MULTISPECIES: hypothetical protein [Vitreoscilla]|uniref:Uncharacterized protein n=1 Tax=Vitreoscilla stercoraria TaxID=61 RepID=A0ABY4E8L3_VITST|nr:MULTISPECIES: hypothetical protein [Vitreoscilla]UOO91678.1 hypothetical protein LVJ81_08480 [Vitreoscilla stercoraria]
MDTTFQIKKDIQIIIEPKPSALAFTHDTRSEKHQNQILINKKRSNCLERFFPLFSQNPLLWQHDRL